MSTTTYQAVILLRECMPTLSLYSSVVLPALSCSITRQHRSLNPWARQLLPSPRSIFLSPFSPTRGRKAMTCSDPSLLMASPPGSSGDSITWLLGNVVSSRVFFPCLKTRVTLGSDWGGLRRVVVSIFPEVRDNGRFPEDVRSAVGRIYKRDDVAPRWVLR